MKNINPDVLAALREQYPPGTRVELLRMDDPQAPAIGTKGTVSGVDDTGSVMVAWDNGASLHVLFSVDGVPHYQRKKAVIYTISDPAARCAGARCSSTSCTRSGISESPATPT